LEDQIKSVGTKTEWDAAPSSLCW